MTLNLLDTALIPVSVEDGGERTVTLPGLMALYGSGVAVELLDLSAHQRAPMHMFLCQVAAAGMLGSNDGMRLDVDEAAWRRRLLSVASEEAWYLVTEDLSSPAFLQPPVPEGSLSGFVRRDFCDDLTTLVTSKNHLQKTGRRYDADPWAWTTALVEIQTMSGYGGRGTYGISRMNGGTSSWVMVSVYTDLSAGGMWRRDVGAIVERIVEISARCPDLDSAGIVAVWTLPWDGKDSLEMKDLHPLYIDCARRVRLVVDRGRIVAHTKTSKVARINAEAINGITGDPWAPIRPNERKSLTVTSDGFTVSLLRQLIVGGKGVDMEPSPLQRPGPGETDVFFRGAVLVGGNGKTGGYHEVTVPIPGEVVFDLFGSEAGRAKVGDIAETMVADANVGWQTLRKTILKLLQNGADQIDVNARESNAAADAQRWRFDKACYDEFFEWLWKIHLGKATRADWMNRVRDIVRDVYGTCENALPLRSMTAFRAKSKARSFMESSLKKLIEERK